MNRNYVLLTIVLLAFSGLVFAQQEVSDELIKREMAPKLEEEPISDLAEGVAGEPVEAEPKEKVETAVEAVEQAVEVVKAPEAVKQVESKSVLVSIESGTRSYLHKSDITDFLKMVSVDLGKNIIPSRGVRGDVTVSLTDVTPREALDVVLKTNSFAYIEEESFICVYTLEEIAKIELANRKTESRVFQLNYISASDAYDVIKPLLSSDAEVSQTPKSSTNEDSNDDWAGSNHLLLVDYPEVLDKVENVLNDIDIRPLQVMIEATILVASLDDVNELGVDFNVMGGVDFGDVAGVFGDVAGGSISGLSGTDISADIGSGGLKIGVVKNNIGLFIKALENITDVVTLGNPKVLTLNKQYGLVRVGGEQGYLGSTEATGTASVSTVEMLETGTILRFRPFVMSDGYIRLELHPEDSTGKVVAKGNGENLPEKTLTEVKANVLVKDGNTIVIGGLFRERNAETRSQIPVLGGLPVVGNLFRSKKDENKKEEVIFMITPHIINNDVANDMGQDALHKSNRLMLGARENISVVSREKIANYHFQRANELMNVGNKKRALWHADMACNISPLFGDAQMLRDELRCREIYDGSVGNMKNFMQDMIQRDMLHEEQKQALSPGLALEQDVARTDFQDALEVVVEPADMMNAATQSGLQTLRSQCELYKIQHNNLYPWQNSDGSTEKDSNIIASRLTNKTDIDGNINENGIFGPYLPKIPANAAAEEGSVFFTELTGESAHWFIDSYFGTVDVASSSNKQF
ncbi:MAG: hypothetical protein JEZ07_09310 [Phycisphaerae bacterium]|nr:hypothetical protein [Phycisphaerae bacterium]